MEPRPPDQCLYEILGVDSCASPRSIQRAWKKQALAHHPDKVPEDMKETAEERFKQVSNAYEILGDAERRRRYDLYGPSLQPSNPFEGGMEPGCAGDFDAAMLEAMLQAAFRAQQRKMSQEPVAKDYRDGLIGIGLLISLAVVWWVVHPVMGRCVSWASWRWRFFMYDLKTWFKGR